MIEQMKARTCDLQQNKADSIKCKDRVLVFGNREDDNTLGYITYCNATHDCLYAEKMIIAGNFNQLIKE